jgi:hypothetical protein
MIDVAVRIAIVSSSVVPAQAREFEIICLHVKHAIQNDVDQVPLRKGAA